MLVFEQTLAQAKSILASQHSLRQFLAQFGSLCESGTITNGQ